MSADVHFQPLDDRGKELLDQLEERTEKRPYLQNDSGERAYWLEAQEVGVDGFDAMLDSIDANWRDHLNRTQE